MISSQNTFFPNPYPKTAERNLSKTQAWPYFLIISEKAKHHRF